MPRGRGVRRACRRSARPRRGRPRRRGRSRGPESVAVGRKGRAESVGGGQSVGRRQAVPAPAGLARPGQAPNSWGRAGATSGPASPALGSSETGNGQPAGGERGPERGFDARRLRRRRSAGPFAAPQSLEPPLFPTPERQVRPPRTRRRRGPRTPSRYLGFTPAPGASSAPQRANRRPRPAPPRGRLRHGTAVGSAASKVPTTAKRNRAPDLCPAARLPFGADPNPHQSESGGWTRVAG